jgi:PhzF family phenazine biosynthesis protein
MEVLRFAAFADPDRPGGGNPAGVVLDADGLAHAQMQRIAADVGFSETAFLAAGGRIRFFSPLAEVPFCGHATLASAVVLAERDGPGPLDLVTPVGEVHLETWRDADGTVQAAFTSVEPALEEFAPGVRAQLCALLGLEDDDLDPDFPPRIAFAGNRHPLLVLRDAGVFDAFGLDRKSVV